MTEQAIVSEEEIAFANPEHMIRRAQSCVAKLDTIKSGEQARELHDFLQDEFMPLCASMVDQLSKLTIVAIQHENRIGLVEESDLIQLDPEFVGSLVEHLEQIGALFEGIQQTTPVPKIAALLKDNKEYVSTLKEELEVGGESAEDDDGDDK